MQRYQSKKIVLAKPMTRRMYNLYRGWDLPLDEEGNDEGYLVEYPDSNKANHSEHKCYISWSPKEVFDKGNNLIGSYADRLINERAELSENISKLSKFTEGKRLASVSADSWELLGKQLQVMLMFETVLTQRIEAL
jgi:hypothetical protein